MLLVSLRAMPEGAWSVDLNSWLQVAALMRRGGNPYNQTTFLNWPPLWMQIIFGLDQLSQHVHVRLVTLMQVTLIAFDSATCAAVYLFLRTHFRYRYAALAVLVGLVLNPVAILLTVVHGNFDVLPAGLVLLAIWQLCRWTRGAEFEAWLWACLLLGLAILAKTWPLVLAPLLLVDWRRLSAGQGLLGLIVLVGPVALGMSVIYSLGPQQVLEHVIQYRSLGGYFGVTGLAASSNVPMTQATYSRYFLVGLLAVMGLVGVAAARGLLTEARLIAVAGLLPLLVITLGPGFGTQYLWWPLPLLVVVFALYGWILRALLALLYVVSSATYFLVYALAPNWGGFALHRPHPHSWDSLSAMFFGNGALFTHFFMPLFITCLIVLVGLVGAALMGKPRGAPERDRSRLRQRVPQRDLLDRLRTRSAP